MKKKGKPFYLELWISGELYDRRKYYNTGRKWATQQLKRAHALMLKRNRWEIYLIEESKMNDLDFRIDYLQIDEVTELKQAS